MKNWKSFLKLPILLAVMSSVHAISAQSPPPPTSSAPSSPTSGISATKSEPAASAAGQFDKPSAKTNWPPAYAGGSDPIAACAAAAEPAASRALIDALENENAALKTRLETEKRTTALLTELNATRKSETEALRTALAAKNEALTAKDAVIASQDKLIETLKRKKPSPWKRIGDVMIGVGLGVLL